MLKLHDIESRSQFPSFIAHLQLRLTTILSLLSPVPSQQNHYIVWFVLRCFSLVLHPISSGRVTRSSFKVCLSYG